VYLIQHLVQIKKDVVHTEFLEVIRVHKNFNWKARREDTIRSLEQ